MPGSSSTNAPKSVVRETTPRTRSPTVYFPAVTSHRMRLELLQADGDAALTVFFGGLEDLDLDLLADGQDVGGLLNARPADFADVQQGIDAAEVDESAVIGEAANDAGDGFAVGEFGITAVARSVRFFFGDSAVIDDNIFFGDVELGHAAADFLSDELFHLGGVARAAAGGGHEGADSDVDAEAAFHDRGNGTENGHALGEGPLQRRPIGGTLDAGTREFVIALFVAALHGDQELVTGFHLPGRRSGRAIAEECLGLSPMSRKTVSAETVDQTVTWSCFAPSVLWA